VSGFFMQFVVCFAKMKNSQECSNGILTGDSARAERHIQDSYEGGVF
jgi:hypothetical protein